MSEDNGLKHWGKSPFMKALSSPIVQGVIGGVISSLICVQLMSYSTPSQNKFGMVNRDILIQKKAQEIAKETLLEGALLERTPLKGALLEGTLLEGTPLGGAREDGELSEEELTAKLQAYKAFYDKAIMLLSREKGIILLNGNAFASSNTPDYTEEVSALIGKLSSMEGKKQIEASAQRGSR